MPLTQDTGVNAIPRNDKSADRLRKTITITGPASYTTGGTLIDPQTSLGFGTLHMIVNSAMRLTSGGTSCRLVALNRENAAAPKLQWYGENFNEIANGTDLSTYSGEIEFIGQ